MADKTYATAIGFVEFPVEERDLDDGRTIRDATIRTPGTPEAGGGALIRVSFWPELWDELEDAGDVLEEGDFLAVKGDYTTREFKGNTYRNMNASRVSVNPSVAASRDREVAKSGKKKAF